MAKFSSIEVGNRILANKEGNLGIGERTPLSKLHVKDGDILVENGFLQLSNSSGAEGGEDGGGTGVALIRFGESEGTTALSNWSMELGYNGDGFSGDSNHMFIGLAGASTSSLNKTMTFTYDQCVGVGVEIPSYKFQVNNSSENHSGTMYISVAKNASGRGVVINSNTRNIDEANDPMLEVINRTGSHALFVDIGGRIGISTGAPTNVMSIDTNGDGSQGLDITYNDTARLRLSVDGTWNYYSGQSGNGHKFKTSNYGDVFYIEGNSEPKTYIPHGELFLRGGQVRLGFFRAHWYNSVTYHHFKTNIPWAGWTKMYSIEILGHEYGAAKPINAQLVWYSYASINSVTNVGNTGSHTMGLYQSSDGFLCIQVTFTSGYYTSYTFNQYTTAQGLHAFKIEDTAFNNTNNHFATV